MADKDKYADEIMSDEELDQVAGGNVGQTVNDICFFKALGVSGSPDDLFAKYGIDYKCHNKPHDYMDNEYVFQGYKDYAHHPRVAALGKVLAGMNYPSYNGQWWDLNYTQNFIREHIGDFC